MTYRQKVRNGDNGRQNLCGGFVRVMPEEEILRIASTLPIRSSCALNWCDVEVHRYRLQQAQIPEHSYPQLTVFIPHFSKPVRGEVYIAGKHMTATLRGDRISIAPPGLPLRMRCEPVLHETTVIFLNQFLLADIATEAGFSSTEILPQYNIYDPLISQIGTALDAELAARTPKPPIYAESLALTLAAHILCRYANPASVRLRRAGPGSVQIQKSIEFMRDNLQQDLTLAEIARSVNMSKYHFAKSFRQAMGISPHRYLTDLRIARARQLLTNISISIEEVAYSVGFTDRSHFSTQFLNTVGTTPGRYRRERSA